jgi:hypothetical protein
VAFGLILLVARGRHSSESTALDRDRGVGAGDAIRREVDAGSEGMQTEEVANEPRRD